MGYMDHTELNLSVRFHKFQHAFHQQVLSLTQYHAIFTDDDQLYEM